MQKLTVEIPVIVEGKYDKIALSAILDARIFTTDGFGLFSETEKAALLRRLAERHGVIVLTDPDGGGRQIRSYLSGILPKDRVTHLYIPEVPGKERRKKAPGKAGLLGVEGMDPETLRQLFAPFAKDAPPRKDGEPVTKQDFYADGFSGRENSAALRDKLSSALSLPHGMTANALLAAVNLLYTRDEYRALLAETMK